MSSSEEASADDGKKQEDTEAETENADGHNTLKYHLLGPSLTKAGQDSVDQQKVRPGESLWKLQVLSNIGL